MIEPIICSDITDCQYRTTAYGAMYVGGELVWKRRTKPPKPPTPPDQFKWKNQISGTLDTSKVSIDDIMSTIKFIVNYGYINKDEYDELEIEFDVENETFIAGTDLDVSTINEFMSKAKHGVSSIIFENGFEYISDFTNAFNGVTLDELDLGVMKTDVVQQYDSAFANGGTIPSNIEKLDVSYASSLANMFNGNRNSSFNVGSWDVKNVASMNGMFSGCENLQMLRLDKWDTSNVISASNFCSSCGNLTIFSAPDWHFHDKGESNLTDDYSGLTSFFNGCVNLTNVYIQNWVVTHMLSTASMFDSCVSLKTLDLSGWELTSLTNSSYMFCNCSSLQTLNVNKFKSQNCQNAIAMFSRCSSLVELDLSQFRTTQVDNMSYIFEGCSNLETLKINQFDASSLQYFDNMFSGCDKLSFIHCTKEFKNWCIANAKKIDLPTSFTASDYAGWIETSPLGSLA